MAALYIKGIDYKRLAIEMIKSSKKVRNRIKKRNKINNYKILYLYNKILIYYYFAFWHGNLINAENQISIALIEDCKSIATVVLRNKNV
ncbi:hypothetical protein [Bartonella sp. C271]|uniref:hypothetical protein n=1 Tax=Bartonella sp. C271 TaxID=3070220 RepID=UPI0038B47CB7